MAFRRAAGQILRSLPYLLHRISGLLAQRPFTGVPPDAGRLDRSGKILLIRLDAIGDLLMTTPAIGALRKKFPQAEIHLLVQNHIAPLARTIPGADRVHTLPCGFLLRGESLVENAWAWFREIWAIRREGFSLAIDFTGLFQSGAAAWLSGAPIRLGFRKTNRFGFFTADGLGHFYTHEWEADETAHVADRMNTLARAVGAADFEAGWQMNPSQSARTGGEGLLAEKGYTPGSARLVIVHPGSKWPPKRWKESNFAEVIDRLQNGGARVALAGGPADGAVIEKIRAACKTHPMILWPPAPLETLSGILLAADCFLGNDSGPMHLAAAAGVPIVAIFGPTSPEISGPRGSETALFYDRLDCSPCPVYFTRDHCHRGHNYCLDGISPAQAAVAVERFLEKRAPAAEKPLHPAS